ncbi:MAG: GGDEF domain-containing protein [Candidatus Daviesbacteria bacterium]|nr:GGDEF domain-containing protein [Candidatus Daviesbacteria bacterium]
MDTESEKRITPEIGPDPEISRIYKAVQSGEMSIEEFADLYDAGGLVEGCLKIDAFERRVSHYLENGVTGSLIAIDVDDFKRFNDQNPEGHLGGDDLLRLIGKIIHKSFRTKEVQEDTKERRQGTSQEKDLLARAGDEFVAYLVDADEYQAKIASKRMWTELVSTVKEQFPGYKYDQTMSIGVSRTRPGDNIKNLRGRADLALYDAKKGKGTGNPSDAISIN